MKIAVATNGEIVAGHFGHCEGFTVYDVEDEEVVKKEFIANPGHSPGFLPRFLAQKGIGCIIAGGMGERARQLFEDNDIHVVTGASGKVDAVVQDFIKGNLEVGDNLCEH